MKYIAVVLGVLLASGCSTSSTHRPSDYQMETNAPQSAVSLFSNDGPSMSDAQIKQALAHRISLPHVNRIAIINLSTPKNSRMRSQEFVQIDNEMITHFIDKLKSSHRIYDASFLPTLLLPEQKTVPFLREAAARYQADLILVYKNGCDNFKQLRFFEQDRVRSYCSTEAVLIDTRTGIVPFTLTSTKQYTVNRNAEELNFYETLRKAELKAINAGLSEVATKLTSHIEATPKL
ncbi:MULTISPECIES: hypothetical protein [Pseudoalteromonas]|uniref:Lipoprotein n=1 Tax=Pseudoalteromonas luteoviolacea (strain 2ta16) TaxID=1353533 RepID=V4H9P1_PSEL2|nr:MULTISPECIES: hypothetical protein [Pseudoalteromonas]ESP94201.1 hypothetical protein PL2TA16_02338 [Pseudoalteromonas luteoviolacea 2ta16]KZN32878.1 hypothetical protein N483_26840 [Pseudoalteromonas luteoviolacea NCIMB 1944]MCG7550325.1 hypothetical protein [Pseudoalteromonas sp. Of7M-16]